MTAYLVQAWVRGIRKYVNDKDREEFSNIDGTRAFLGLNSEGAEIEKMDPMLKRIQPTSAAVHKPLKVSKRS